MNNKKDCRTEIYLLQLNPILRLSVWKLYVLITPNIFYLGCGNIVCKRILPLGATKCENNDVNKKMVR